MGSCRVSSVLNLPHTTIRCYIKGW